LQLRRSTLTDASPAEEKPKPPAATNDPSTDVVGAIKAETKPDAADAEKPASEPAGNETAAKPEAASAATPKAADESGPGEKSVQATPDKQEPSSKPATATEPAKDQSRSLDPNQAGVAKPEPASAPEAKRSGPPIAVFISRKDGKLYARQNFAPLFDLPIAIAPSDRPLGTHVFTAQADKDDGNVLRWSAVSLPVAVRRTEPRDSDDRATRRRKIAGAVDMPPAPSADSAAEALDRLSIPPETIARIAAALSPGGSIILSDQGIAAGETGEGTDFIIRLR
jgi:hypothetical protein